MERNFKLLENVLENLSDLVLNQLDDEDAKIANSFAYIEELVEKIKEYTLNDTSIIALDQTKTIKKLKKRIEDLEYELRRKPLSDVEKQNELLIDLVRQKMKVIQELEYLVKKRSANSEEIEELRDELQKKQNLITQLEEIQMRSNQLKRENEQLRNMLEEMEDSESRRLNDMQMRINQLENENREKEQLKKPQVETQKSKYTKELMKYDTLDKVNASINLRTKRLMNLAKDIEFSVKGKKTRLADVSMFDMDKIILKLLENYQKDKKYAALVSELQSIRKVLKKIEKLEIYKRERFNA